MIKIDAKHYTETVIHSIDLIIRSLKQQLKQKIDNMKIGITGEQFVVLDTISSLPGIYQQRLSEILMKDKSNTTRILKVLEEQGLIKREMGNYNNRLVYFLYITLKGKKILNEIMPMMKEFLVDIFENITDDEIALLHQLSSKFQSDLDSMNERF
jgi:DNA-binding MarR family transcriptional regulator